MQTLNCNGQLLDLSQPCVMGIINVNQNSFYTKSRHASVKEVLITANQMIQDGAKILDIGGVSTRPGSQLSNVAEELNNVLAPIEAIKNEFPDIIISIDTYHSEVAESAILSGASIINDISAWKFDDAIPHIAKNYNCPYILMHMQGTPQDMQLNPVYDDVTLEILDFFIEKVDYLKHIDLHDVIIDPGFGFGKNINHNYELLNRLHVLNILNKPILAGLSRKRMFWGPLETDANSVLPATIAANLLALQQGAKILRVHDVYATAQLIKTFELIQQYK